MSPRPMINVTHDAHVALVRPQKADPRPGERAPAVPATVSAPAVPVTVSAPAVPATVSAPAVLTSLVVNGPRQS